MKFKYSTFGGISCSETNQISFLSHREHLQRSKTFLKWPPHSLIGPKRKQISGLFSDYYSQDYSLISFRLRQFFPALKVVINFQMEKFFSEEKWRQRHAKRVEIRLYASNQSDPMIIFWSKCKETGFTLLLTKNMVFPFQICATLPSVWLP